MSTKQKAGNFKLCYCIPVMNRKEDIKATLAHNIFETMEFDDVSIIVHCFDHESFIVASEIISQTAVATYPEKYCVHLLDPLPFWHFCWAKNSFVGTLKADYYSSLDGDNFLDKHEVRQTLDIISGKPYEHNYLIHHFSGEWGDGTSGRITIPASIYESVKYNARLFSRQFDEIGLLSEALLADSKSMIVSNLGVDIRFCSHYFREFCVRTEISDHRFIQYDLCGSIKHHKKPLNPRGQSYVDQDERLAFFQEFNSLFSFYSACSRVSNEHAEYYLNRSKAAFENGIELLLEDTKAWQELFDAGVVLPCKSSQLTVYSVIKNDLFFLEEWYHHYKSIGVKRFIIIDDYSDTAISESLPYDDVFIFKPRVGDFKTLKVKWIQLLLASYQVEGSWAITVDADEMIDPTLASQGLSTLTSILEYANKHLFNFIGGILCEMLPSANVEAENLGLGYPSRFHHVYLRERLSESVYKSKMPIKWAFGDYWPLSYMFDYRFRVCGTIDSLRKVPIFRYSKDLLLNQGFHGITRAGVEMSAHDFASAPILPIKHFKSVKVYAEGPTDLLAANKESYFTRTTQNLNILAKSKTQFILIRRFTPFVREYDSGHVSRAIEWVTRLISEKVHHFPISMPHSLYAKRETFAKR